MPSARSNSFKSGAGFLRKVDGTILDIQGTDTLPGQSSPAISAKGFHSLFAVLTIQQDGREGDTKQALFVGDAQVFGVTEDGRGFTGPEQFSSSSGWGIFLDSLEHGTDFDYSLFDSDDPNVVDFTPLIGARVRFDQVVNEKLNKSKGKRKDKTGKIDPKTGKVVEYDNTDLIVTNYYGQVDVEPVKATPVARVVAAPKAVAKVKKSAAPAIDISTVAAENIILALSTAKNQQLVKARLGVKLIQVMNAAEPTTRDSVREWADNNDNLSSIEGVNFDAATQMLALEND